MRILAIRGEHLASLYQPFELDFRQEPLAGAGLFAITGPTGAGKSTILDAVCLALYGDTPRVEGSGGPEVALGLAEGEEDQKLKAKDARNLLSRGSKAGFAEVDFRAQDGADYRARWSVAARLRARKLSEADMSVVQLADGAVLATGLAASRAAVERLVGFNFEEFLKAVLLPQGQFAEFLRANAKERADILEKVTGGQIYTRLGELADQRQREAVAQLEALEAKAGSYQPLDEAQRAAREAERAKAEIEVREARTREQAAREAVAWHEEAGRREGALSEAETQAAAAGKERATAGPRRAELALVEQAIARREPLDAVRRAEKAVGEATQAIEQRRRAADEAAAAAQVAATALAEAGAVRQAVADERARTAPALEAARQLDAQVTAAAEQAERERKAFQEAQRQADVARQAVDAAARNSAALARTQAAGARWFEERRAEAPVVAEWPRWREAIERHRDASVRSEQARRQLAQVATPAAVEQAREEAATAGRRRDELAALSERSGAEAEAAERRTEEREGQVEGARGVEQQARAVQQLDARRAELKPGEACPLCGSTEHPWAGRGALDETVARAEAHRKELERLLAGSEAAALRLREAASQAQRKADEARVQAEERDRKAALLAGELEKAGRAAIDAALAQAEADRQLCEASLAQPFAGVPGWREALAAGHGAVLERWERVAAEHAAHRGTLEESATGLAEAQRALEVAGAGAEALVRAAQTAARADAAARAELERVQAERARLLGGRAVAEVVKALEARFDDADAKLARANERVQAAVAARESAGGRLEEAQAQLVAARQAADGALAGLLSLLAELAIDRAAFEARVDRGATWAAAERRQLDAIDAADRDAATLVAERGRALAQHEVRRPPLDLPAAEQARTQAEAQASEADQLRVAAEAELRRDEEVRTALAELAPRLRAQRERTELAERLAELIGGQGAKSFRIFAQGLALESLLAHANRHLEQLAPRYRLARIPGTDLDLQVIDQDVGGAARGVNSLSGGETFLVSLGLALGLSGLASRSVRVETLFVDEGFGTLDPQALDQAMAVLEGLRATGRTVGIITHVPELHERVEVAVEVEKLGAGRSRVRAVRVG